MDWLKVDIASFVAILTSIVALWRAWRMTPHEEQSADSGTVKQYEEAASMASERAIKMSERLEKLEERMNKVVEDNRVLRDENKEYLETLTVWAEGISLLLMQIRANQLTAAWIPQQEVIEKFREKGRKR